MQIAVEEGSLGPVQTEEGFTPCLFTGKVDGVAVEGTYDPTRTRSDLNGVIRTLVNIQGTNYAARIGPMGPYGLCGQMRTL